MSNTFRAGDPETQSRFEEPGQRPPSSEKLASDRVVVTAAAPTRSSSSRHLGSQKMPAVNRQALRSHDGSKTPNSRVIETIVPPLAPSLPIFDPTVTCG